MLKWCCVFILLKDWLSCWLTVVKQMNEHYHDCVRVSRQLQQQLGSAVQAALSPQIVIATADKLIYNYAIELVRSSSSFQPIHLFNKRTRLLSLSVFQLDFFLNFIKRFQTISKTFMLYCWLTQKIVKLS